MPFIRHLVSLQDRDSAKGTAIATRNRTLTKIVKGSHSWIDKTHHQREPRRPGRQRRHRSRMKLTKLDCCGRQYPCHGRQALVDAVPGRAGSPLAAADTASASASRSPCSGSGKTRRQHQVINIVHPAPGTPASTTPASFGSLDVRNVPVQMGSASGNARRAAARPAHLALARTLRISHLTAIFAL